MAPDQRYCLSCGARRGDPRLPFMDAVVFMESMHQAPAVVGTGGIGEAPQRQSRRRVSPNASLITGVATLVLAIGVGVLIGRSGEDSSGTVANATPSVITVQSGGGGGTDEEAAAGPTKAKTGGPKAAKGKAAAQTGSSGTSKAAEEVLKPSGDVKLAPPTQEVGGSCQKGTAGCSESGKFDGSFFGE